MPRVVHFEIHADNPQRAVDFYTQAFGWSFQKWDGPQEYWLITTGEQGTPGIDGGLTQRMGPPPAAGASVNASVCTVDVPSVDKAIAAVEKAGGTIALPKQAVPGVGWLFYFKDTEGNIMGAMENDPAAA
ncbi:MAG: VOC family protein [Caldilineaceae bacterium]|nr:VOC family protein [Caldilineaceae bacterium]